MSHRRHGRRTPYTTIGIRRLPCSRCGSRPSAFQWQVCADGNLWRPLCAACDVAMNQVVLAFMGDPEDESKMARYRAKIG